MYFCCFIWYMNDFTHYQTVELWLLVSYILNTVVINVVKLTSFNFFVLFDSLHCHNRLHFSYLSYDLTKTTVLFEKDPHSIGAFLQATSYKAVLRSGLVSPPPVFRRHVGHTRYIYPPLTQCLH